MIEKEEVEEKEAKPKKKPGPRKRSAPSLLKKELSISLPDHKESCNPTFYEETLEENSISDYETETVPLTLFTLHEVVYFRDATKNKLYRRIKEKTLGPYVGRYDPISDKLVTDIPDSDEE
jgi:hypothetical protein